MTRSSARLAGAAALAAAGAGLILGLHRANPRFLVSAHGLLHAAVVQRFRIDGWVVPPENPFFAGEPLPYYWAFHALAALLGAPFGLDPLRSLELVIVLAWIGLVVACVALAPRLYGRAGLGLLAAWLVVAGANLQAPLLAGYRLLRVGPSLLEDRGTYLWGLAHPMLGSMRLWDGGALYGPLVNFFLNVTSRPVALAGLVAVVALLAWVLARGGVLRAAALAIATAFTTAMSVVVGLPAALALAGGLLVARLRPGSAAAGHWPGLLPAVVALGAGAAAGFLPAAHLRAAAGAGPPLGDAAEALTKLGAMAAAAWPVGLLAAVGWWRTAGPRRALVEALGLAALALAAGNLLLSLPVGNEVNLYHAGLVLTALAAPAAFAPGDAPRAPRGAPWVALAFLPTFAMVVACYAVRPPVPLRPEGARLVRTDLPAARAYAWLRDHAPPRAVIVAEPGPPPLAVSGNTSEVPALTGRVLWTERPTHYVVAPHADAEPRAAIARALVAGERLAPAQRAALQALGRPILLLVDPRLPPEVRAEAQARHGPALFADAGWAVYAPALEADAAPAGEAR